jgi:hypothetical protein
MIAELKAGSAPGQPTYINPEDLCQTLIKIVNGQEFCTHQELSWWAKNGRLGSRFQLDGRLYVKVKEEGDDPMKYYTPPTESANCSSGSAPWGASSACAPSGDCDDDCGKCE